MKLLFVEFKKLHRIKLIPLVVFAMFITLGTVFIQGQFSYTGVKYINVSGWYMKQVQSLATYFVLPGIIALLGSYIVCREEQEDVLKSLKLIPVDEKNMLLAKMSITFLLSVFIYAMLFIASAIIEMILHTTADAMEMSEIIHFLVVYVLSGVGVFIAISPIVAIVGIVKKSYWLALVIAEIYSFVGIFFASNEIIRAIYPVSSVFIFSGAYGASVIEIFISMGVLILCMAVSFLLLKKLRFGKAF